MSAGTQYSVNLNTDTVGIKTPAFYDATQNEWMMASAVMVKNSSGLWTPLQLDPNNNLKVSINDRNSVLTATIPSGQSLSNEIDLGGYTFIAIEMPDAWDTADLTFQASSTSGGVFKDVYDDAGVEVQVSASANRIIGIKSSTLNALRFIKIRSGTSAVPVIQTAERVLKVIVNG